MAKFIGNCANVIDWDEVIKSLKGQTPAHSSIPFNRNDPVPGIKSMYEIISAAGYHARNEGGSVGWEIYDPVVNFDSKIADMFAKWAGLPKFTAAWISCVNPGDVSPWHWDVTNDEPTLNKTEFIRLHCHMQDTTPGHCLFLEDKCYYDYKKGDVYQWRGRDIWHGGANCGLTPMYTFNFWF